MDHECARNIDQVQGAEQERDFLPGPVAAVQDDDGHQQDHAGNRQPGRHAEYVKGGGHADEFGDERQPVHQHQVDQREPAPKRAEAVENRLGVAALGDRAQAHRHLLHVIGHRDQQQQEPDQVVAVLGARGRVGGDTAGVVVGDHHDDARSGDDQIELDRLPHFAQLVIQLGKVIHRANSIGFSPQQRGNGCNRG